MRAGPPRPATGCDAALRRSTTERGMLRRTTAQRQMPHRTTLRMHALAETRRES